MKIYNHYGDRFEPFPYHDPRDLPPRSLDTRADPKT